MIKVENVTKYYDFGEERFTALNNINLTINSGEFVAITGQSGSGKSTLLQLIGGLDKTSMGRIIVDEIDISKLNDVELSRYRNRKIGFVFQSFNLESTQTALENVIMPLMLGGVMERERNERAEQALDMVGLKHKAKNKPSEMSGGERQRVSIARAIVNKAEIILADEPTGNLDSKNGEAVMRLLKELNDKEYTIVLVTHNMNDIGFVNRVIKIKDGQVEE